MQFGTRALFVAKIPLSPRHVILTHNARSVLLVRALSRLGTGQHRRQPVNLDAVRGVSGANVSLNTKKLPPSSA